jgi:hypothetical protein
MVLIPELVAILVLRTSSGCVMGGKKGQRQGEMRKT